MAMTADTDEWSVTLIRAPIVHIPIYPVSHCRTALPARLGEFSWLVVAIVRGVRTESSSRLAGRARCRSVLSGCRNFNGGPLSSSALFRHSVMQCPVFSTGGSPSRRTPSEPETVGMSSARLARVDAVMQHRYVDSGYLPGTPTYVYRKRHLVHTGMCGHMYIERDKPMREDAIFRIYSMTKPITAVALMMLVEEGLIGLGDDVDSHIPAWKNLGVYASRISSLLPDTPPSFLTAPVLRP